MSKIEIRQKRRIRELEAALRPFADVTPAADVREVKDIYPDKCGIWLYAGEWTEGQESPHLLADHFENARRLFP